MSLSIPFLRKHPGRCASLLLAIVVAPSVVACNSDSEGDEPSAITQPPPIPEDDVAYIDFLAPHHEAAIQMADEEIQRGDSAEVRAMASDMKAAQVAEIQTLQRIRTDLTGNELSEEDLQAQMTDPHMTIDMDAMQDATGAELDQAFLWHMVPHHGSAVVVSHRALPNLENAELRDLAETTVVAQTREMNVMLDMLGE